MFKIFAIIENYSGNRQGKGKQGVRANGLVPQTSLGLLLSKVGLLPRCIDIREVIRSNLPKCRHQAGRVIDNIFRVLLDCGD
jgi:hypothetical protein